MTTLREIKTFFNEKLFNDVSFIKTGTESESMLPWMIALLMSITHKEAICKIGGPDARSDIFSMLHIGIQRFVAPMIESPFGVKKFIEAITKTIRLESVEELTINVESICAFSQIESILEAAKGGIHRINVGFSDLAASMGTNVMDAEILRMAKALRNRCKIMGRYFSFGGTVTPANIVERLAYLEPDSFETRLLVFPADISDPAGAVRKALEFEAAFETHVATTQQALADSSTNRAIAINRRLASELSLAA